MGDQDRAVVVGVSRYPALGDLQGPENDAVDFAEWLKAPGGGAVPEERIDLILSSLYEYPDDDPLSAEPTTVRLERAFDRLHDIGSSSGGRAGSRLFIYMAGHGFAPTIEDAALLMANAAKGRTGHHIPGRPYANWFRAAAFFDEVVLFMDCCRENYPRAPVRGPPYEPLTTSRVVRYFYGFATEYSRAARERAIGEAGEVHGVFSAALLAGLRGGASTADGSVTGSSLQAFVFNYLRQLEDGSEEQEPRFEWDTRYDVVLAHPRSATFLVRARPRDPRDSRGVELLDGRLQAVAGRRATASLWEWDVGAGLYKLVPEDGEGQVLELIGEARTVDVAF